MSDLNQNALEFSGQTDHPLYPFKINPYLENLLETRDGLRRQWIPDVRETEDADGMEDPLGEELDSPVPNITHRYPDRVLFVVTTECAAHCRFCTRKRKVGKKGIVTEETLRAGLAYIRSHTEVKDVLVSGGDPLMLSDAKLESILKALHEIPHVQIIRIGTRVPGILPERITPALTNMLARYRPLYLNLHFNHPDEITLQVEEACQTLSEAGLVLSSQTVLLKEINDDPNILETLFRKLLTLNVRPYYLLQCDPAEGTAHFRTSIGRGIDIMRTLQGTVSGLALPKYMVDLPGGGGKVPVSPDFLVSQDETGWVFQNFKGKQYRYPRNSRDYIPCWNKSITNRIHTGVNIW